MILRYLFGHIRSNLFISSATMSFKSIGSFARSLHLVAQPKNQLNNWPSGKVRSTFVSFYENLNHQHVASSPVVPWTDTSLEYVNAGMNQFKPILLGEKESKWKRVVNSQKCIRVGGKHNDLQDVGRDGYHHTFFEMLGSWSFNDYFKKEACEMAWRLLTKEYGIPIEHLYVTYFGGDETSGLQPDLEVKDIWASLGVPSSRILPFGLKDNFWEMGSHGPCGPCTEIHYEQVPSVEGPLKVNRGYSDLVELWNLVFVQYERLPDGSLVPLKTQHHVDTGMGFERIVATLNGKTSNYDTDLFAPFFERLHNLSSNKLPYSGSFAGDNNNIDTAYRIIADHSRMMTVALADGILPHDSYVLRKMIRQSLLLGWEKLGIPINSQFLLEMSQCCGETLGETYPEIAEKMPTIQNLLLYEEEKYKCLQSELSKEWSVLTEQEPQLKQVTNISATFIEGLKSILPTIQNWKSERDVAKSTDEAAKWCRQFSINIALLEDMSSALNLHLDLEEVKELVSNIDKKETQKSNFDESGGVNTGGVSKTDDSFKYHYKSLPDGTYEFEDHKTKVSNILKAGTSFDSITENDSAEIVLQTTSMYCPAGGQISDTGTLNTENGIFNVERVLKNGDTIVHIGKVSSGSISCGDEVHVNINQSNRLGASKIHTAHHLVMASLEGVNGMSYQRESYVTSDKFIMDVFTHPPLTLKQIRHAEKIVQEWIKQKLDINRRTVDIVDALKEKPKLLLGKTYPYDVHIVTSHCTLPEELCILDRIDSKNIVNVRSCELCCGTHIENTGHLGDFSFTDVQISKDNGITRLSGIVGKEATLLNKNVSKIQIKIENWENKIHEALKKNEKVRGMDKELRKWRLSIKKSSLPCTVYLLTTERIDALLDIMSAILKQPSNWLDLQEEFNNVQEKHVGGPLIHTASTDYRGSQSDLENTINLTSSHPIASICKGWGRVRVVTYVPPNMSVNIKSIFEEIETCTKMQCQTNVRATENGGNVGTLLIIGVKRDELDPMRSNMKNICEQYFTN